LHARGFVVVGELGEIMDGQDAKLPDLGQSVQLGIAQLVGPVTIYIVRAAGSSEDQLDLLLARERGAATASGSAGFSVTLIGPFLLTANSFQPSDGVPAGAIVRLGTTVHVALWAAEVVDFRSVKTSRHGMAPWTATIREKGKGKRLVKLRGSFPSVQGKQPISPLLCKRPSFSENLNWLFSGAFGSLYFRGLEKGKCQRESWEGAAVD